MDRHHLTSMEAEEDFQFFRSVVLAQFSKAGFLVSSARRAGVFGVLVLTHRVEWKLSTRSRTSRKVHIQDQGKEATLFCIIFGSLFMHFRLLFCVFFARLCFSFALSWFFALCFFCSFPFFLLRCIFFFCIFALVCQFYIWVSGNYIRKKCNRWKGRGGERERGGKLFLIFLVVWKLWEHWRKKLLFFKQFLCESDGYQSKRKMAK